MSTRVRMEAFSGLEDPSWELSPAETEEIDARLGRLAETGSDRQPPTALGYRGLVLEGLSRFTSVIVHRDRVWVNTAGRNRVLADPQRSMEKFILRTSYGRVTSLPHVSAIQNVLGGE